MAWFFKRHINLGPLRINFSKSGVGFSFGIKGARVGMDSKGRKYSHLGFPGTGVYSRKFHGSRSHRSKGEIPFDKFSPEGRKNRFKRIRIWLFNLLFTPTVLLFGWSLYLQYEKSKLTEQTVLEAVTGLIFMQAVSIVSAWLFGYPIYKISQRNKGELEQGILGEGDRYDRAA